MFFDILDNYFAGVTQLARASAFQAESCGFESHRPLNTIINNIVMDIFCA